MNMVSIKINGMEYNLKGDENEEYLHKVALNVDKKIKNILQKNSMLSTASASVLAAVNMMDELLKAQNESTENIKKIKDFEQQKEKYEQKITTLKKEASILREMNEKLQSKISGNTEENTNQIKTKEKDESISKLSEQIDILIEEGKLLKSKNKDLELQLEASKYKVLDLQNKILGKKIEKGNTGKNNYKKNMR